MSHLREIASIAILAGQLLGCGSYTQLAVDTRNAPPTADTQFEQDSIEGLWEGTITLSKLDGARITAPRTGPVRIKFANGTYAVSGSSDLARGGGAYDFGASLRLEPEGFRTADFDWTLILEGVFNTMHLGDRLYLEQYDWAHSRHRRIVLSRAGDADTGN